MNKEKVLVWTLRLVGGFELLAFFAIFMPTAWMAATHTSMGMGPFPEAPLTQYLTRSVSALYAIHGGFLWLFSSDVRRFAPAIRYLGWAHLLFGVVVAVIDVQAGVPFWWTVTEGPPIFAIGLLFLWLVRDFR